MRFLKSLIKVILPPVIAFFAFAVFIKFTPFFHHINAASEIGDDSVYGLISYYKIFAPFQIVIALLTQWIIIIPLWDAILARPLRAIIIFISLIVICAAAAFGLAYTIWDRTTGTKHLGDACLFMFSVQLFYWIINFGMLYLLDWKAFRKNDKAKSEQVDEPNL